MVEILYIHTIYSTKYLYIFIYKSLRAKLLYIEYEIEKERNGYLNTYNTFISDLAKTIMLLFGKVTVASTISIGYLYTIETFPTVIRGSCLGLCVVFAKLGSLSMPYSLLSV